MKTKLSLLLCAIFISLTSFSALAQTQVPPIIWTQQYGASGGCYYGMDVVTDSTGVYMVGQTELIAKYDPQGSLLWSRDSGPDPSGCYGNYSVVIDGTGIYAAGPTSDHSAGHVRKYDFNGTLLWEQSLDQFTWGIALDATGVYVDAESYIRKYSLDGTELWTRDIVDGFGNMKVAVDGAGIYVTSYSGPILKYDLDGNLLWTTSNPGSVLDMKIDPTGVYVVGLTTNALSDQTFFGGATDAFVRKYDLNGNELWTREFGTDHNDLAEGVFVNATGVYIAGSTDGGSFPNYTIQGVRDAFVCKYSLDGTQLWLRQFGGASLYMEATNVTVDRIGNIYVVGGLANEAVSPSYSYAWLTKLSAPNTAPVAVISPFQPIILGESMNLNGSSSYDPDGSITNYSWDFGDHTSGSGVTTTHTYSAAGVYTITLTVTDNGGLTGITTVTAMVQTPSQAIGSLVQSVQAMNLAQGIQNSLDAKLRNANDALSAQNAGNRADAVNKLEAFINAAMAQSGNQLTGAQANQLIAYANRIIAVL